MISDLIKMLRIRKSLRLLICNDEGILHMYSLDQEDGGDCSLIKQFKLVETKTVIDQSQILETTETLVKQGIVCLLGFLVQKLN